MKKIRANFNQKDRVVCITNQGYHEFFYQPVGSRERILLFVTDEFSGSVWTYFRDKGRNVSGRGFSLTISELYEFKHFHNVKLTNVINRIPVMIDYVLREQIEEKEEGKKTIITGEEMTYGDRSEDCERAA